MRTLLAGLLAAAAFAQDPSRPAGTALLPDIRIRVAQNISRLPDYTCRQTIDRSVRQPRSPRFVHSDTLRLEVAYVGGREMFAWPGSKRFDERGLSEMVESGGAVGNGNFGMHIRAVFLDGGAAFEHTGNSTINGRRRVHFAYRVSRPQSRYMLSNRITSALVAYHGSFSVDAVSLDLVEFSVEADDIPAQLGITAARETIQYARTRVGESEFLLPRSSELSMTDDTGRVSRNVTRFDACRQYTGESVVSFADPVESRGAPAAVADGPPVPPGASLSVRLKTPLDDTAAVGDPVSAEVMREVRKPVAIPKGAVLSGRVVRVVPQFGPRGEFHAIAIKFDLLETGSLRRPVSGHIEAVMAPQNLFSATPPVPGAPPGVDAIYQRGPRLHIPAGLMLSWRTAEFGAEPEPAR